MTETLPKQDFFNGFGRFVDGEREYEIILDGDNRPPAPWINVISNQSFGFHVSETGAGYTWSCNSRENKLTPWSNDPVTDRAGEAIYIKDEITGRIMTPTSLGSREHGIYRTRHGYGYSVFLHEEEELEQKLTVFTPLEEPIKLWLLEMKNCSDRERYFSVTCYLEWVLGVDRELTNPYILTDYDNEHEYLRAKSIYNYHYRKHHAFLFSNEMIQGYTGDRQEFLGEFGSVRNPSGLFKTLSNNTGVCYDSCGVITVSVAIPAGSTKTILFGLGHSEDFDIITNLRYKYKDISRAIEELQKVKAHWDRLLGKIKVETKDKAIDLLVNGWLLYQSLSCRINARAAFYQCGGAYGFRDQLQDALALLYSEPKILRDQLLISCSRQFEEGDVQHWWHPPTGVGVRTRISDDLLWLPYTTAAYINCTGDYSILQEEVFYIKGAILGPEQHETMITPEVSELKEKVYEHCKRTILHTGFGQHGLPLMGGGDWNDGLSEVGIEGKGESVWLAWFLYAVLKDFIPICIYMGDTSFASELERMGEKLLTDIEENAWDGEWYLRAFYDDGTKLGSKENDECRIDSICQSWSILSHGAREDRAEKAIQSALRYLVKEKDGISLLLAPPFDKTNKRPGYIKNYYPGVRENGGQYTHAAVWLAIANTMIGNYSMAYTLFTMLNPIYTTNNKKDAIKYEKEPYVMTADISLNAPYSGRGGWSWYTGSAGWMYQGLVKWFLGIRKEKDELIITPGTPVSFGDYTVWYQYGNTTYRIEVERKSSSSTLAGISENGTLTEGNRIRLVDDGKQHVLQAVY